VDDLIDVILTGFKFDRDHLYDVKLRDRSGRIIEIAHPACDGAEYFTDEFAIGFLPIDPGQSMTLLSDYGDSWQFIVKLEQILPANSRIKNPKITARQGKVPRQYNYDDCW